MSYYEFAFTGQVETLAIGKTNPLHYSVILLPDELIATLPFATYPRLRVIGEVAEMPVRGAWQPVGDGRKYFILSAQFLKAAGLAVGAPTEMRFNIDDQDYVEVPAILADSLKRQAEIQKIWDSLTAGKKRFHSHSIASAKTEATRAKRTEIVINMLRDMHQK